MSQIQQITRKNIKKMKFSLFYIIVGINRPEPMIFSVTKTQLLEELQRTKVEFLDAKIEKIENSVYLVQRVYIVY